MELDLLDDAQREAYDRRFQELLLFGRRDAREAHQLAYQFALATRPPVIIPPEGLEAGQPFVVVLVG